MLRMGINTPNDSEWAANAVLVRKKAADGGPITMQLTID